jgi:hypothetical protein
MRSSAVDRSAAGEVSGIVVVAFDTD